MDSEMPFSVTGLALAPGPRNPSESLDTCLQPRKGFSVLPAAADRNLSRLGRSGRSSGT